MGQPLGEVGALRHGIVHGLEQRQRLFVASAVHQGASQLPVVLALGLHRGGAGIVGHGVDVTEGDEVLEHGLAFAVVELERNGFRRCRAGLLVRGDIGRKILGGQGVAEDAAFHVISAGQAEPREDGRGDIGQARTEDFSPARAEAWSRSGDDALGAVPDNDAGGDARGEAGTEVVAVEAVVGDDHDPGVGSGQIDEAHEHEVVQAVGAVDHVVVVREIFFRRTFHARGMEGHEEVADFVDGAEIDHGEIPLAVFHQPSGGGLHAEGLGQLFGQHDQAAVFLLVDFVRIGDEHAQHVAAEFVRADPQGGEVFGERFGPEGARRRRGPIGRRLDRFLRRVGEQVGDHAHVGVAFALRGEPSDEVGLESALGENVPDRAAAAGGSGDGHDLLVAHLGEAMHPVLGGVAPGGDGRPEHGRERWLQRGQVAVHAFAQDLGHHGHGALLNERVDDFPVGRIPTDNKEAFAGHERPITLTAESAEKRAWWGVGCFA